MALLGGALLYRGTTGHCHLYAATGSTPTNRRGLASSGKRLDTDGIVPESAAPRHGPSGNQTSFAMIQGRY